MAPALDFVLLFLWIHSCTQLHNLFCYGRGSHHNVSLSRCPGEERRALLDLVVGNMHGYPRPTTWVGENCCRWAGIGCDHRTGNVVRVDLHNRNLILDLNHSFLALRRHLRYLDLSSNNPLHYNVSVPNMIGSFQKLRYLNLSFTFYYGTVPHQLGNLSRLQTLSLNSLYDQYYEWIFFVLDDPSWLSSMTSLQHLEIGLRRLGAGWVHALNMLPSIREIHIHSEQVIGGIPSTSLGVHLNFTSLSVFDLSFSAVNSELPSWLSNLTGLEHLDLRHCNLTGPVPDFLWNLSCLEVLDLSLNQLTGSIPQSLRQLSQLEYLDLSNNLLSINMTEAHFASLTRLKYLDLSYCNLGGPVPDFLWNLSSLEVLDLSQNQLIGSISQSLGRLSQLEHLDLSNNSLSTNMTEAHFASLARLKYLDISTNYLMVLNVSFGWHPPFQLNIIILDGCLQVGARLPRWIRTQRSLSMLSMSNAGIRDSIPDWFWSLVKINYLYLSHNNIFGTLPTTLPFPNLEVISLRSNRLFGPLPHLINPNMLFLDLSNNLFSGPIPYNSGKKRRLSLFLLLSGNNLTGSVPQSICEFRNLYVLDLSKNHLMGEIPNCELPSVQILDLSDNNLSGGVPHGIFSNGFLQALYLSNNNLSGELPSSLRKCKSLQILDLADNKLTGTLPYKLSDKLELLSVLSLRSNMFYGVLPTSLFLMPSLRILDLSHNNLSGEIPPIFSNISPIERSSDYSFKVNSAFDFTVITFLWLKGKEQEYNYEILNFETSIDLSHNEFSGTIPEELASMTWLQSLNLSGNHLTGEITIKIGEMQQLESLDLSHNKLSGLIPQSLDNLSYLGYLDLSDNNLSGRIPSGGHLDTSQDPSSYMGNPYLIENQLGNETNQDPSAATVKREVEVEDDNISEMFWLYIGIAPGFVVGIWAVLGPLLFKATWRYEYFRSIDVIYDKICVTRVVNPIMITHVIRKLFLSS